MEKEAIQRLELFGFDNNFLKEIEKDFKIKVADGETSRDMNSFEEGIVEKVLSKAPGTRTFLPYYITKYYLSETERYYLSIFYVDHIISEYEFLKRLIKTANYTFMIESDITDPENITLRRRKGNIMKKFGNALYPIDYTLYKEEAENNWKKMKRIYEERERKAHEESLKARTRVYRLAQPGENIIIEPPFS